MQKIGWIPYRKQVNWVKSGGLLVKALVTLLHWGHSFLLRQETGEYKGFCAEGLALREKPYKFCHIEICRRWLTPMGTPFVEVSSNTNETQKGFQLPI